VLVTVFWLLRGRNSGAVIESQWQILANSTSISAIAALITVAAALPVAFGAVRHPGFFTRQSERLAYLGHALPGIVVAIALVFLGSHYAPALYQSQLLLAIAYMILFLPLALGTVRAALIRINPRTEEVACLLGRSRHNLFLTVTLPQLRPGLFTGFALIFLTALKELPATLLLGPTGFETLATRIWGATEEAFFAEAAAPALLLILAATLALLILQHQESPDRKC
jgi:iron(III) transport system permease protein